MLSIEQFFNNVFLFVCVVFGFYLVTYLNIIFLYERINTKDLYIFNKLRLSIPKDVHFYKINPESVFGVNIPFVGNYVFTKNSTSLNFEDITEFIKTDEFSKLEERIQLLIQEKNNQINEFFESIEIFCILMAINKSRNSPYKYIFTAIIGIVLFVLELYVVCFLFLYFSYIFFLKIDEMKDVIYACKNMHEENLIKLKYVYSKKIKPTTDVHKYIKWMFKIMFTDNLPYEIVLFIFDSFLEQTSTN